MGDLGSQIVNGRLQIRRLGAVGDDGGRRAALHCGFLGVASPLEDGLGELTQALALLSIKFSQLAQRFADACFELLTNSFR